MDYVYTGQENLEMMLDADNYNHYQRDFIRRAAESIPTKSKKKVLDFGAGIGTYADMIKGTGLEVGCVEIDPNGVKVLKQKGYKVYRSLDQVKEKYDIIYALNVLEHLKDDAKMLTAMKQPLSKQGLIVIYVPAFMLLFSGLDVKVEHFRRYRFKDMERLATDCGLTIVDMKYCDPVGFMSALLYRLFRGNGELRPAMVHFFDKVLFPISVFIEPATKRLFGKNVLVTFKVES